MTPRHAIGPLALTLVLALNASPAGEAEIQDAKPANTQPPVCTATITGWNIPVQGSITWNPTAGCYDYSTTWTVSYTCSTGGVSNCCICYATQVRYSADGGDTWSKLPVSTGQSTATACGYSYVLYLNTTITCMVSGDMYQIQFCADVCGSDACTTGLYPLLYTQSFTCPSPPSC
jgi:hypothetical protein